MAHNISRSKKAAFVRANPVSLYTGFDLVCSCSPCRDTRSVAVDTLLETLGEARDRETVSGIIGRLRCRSCRGPVSGVVVTDNALMRVAVWGPEAF